MDWMIHLQVNAPVEDPIDAADQLMDLLEGHAPAIAADESGWDATVSVDADDHHDAIASFEALISSVAKKAGLPLTDVVRLEAVRGDELDRELATPNYPDLVSGPEAAQILGVTRQRVHTLAGKHRDFPRPLYQLAVGSLWARAAIEKFAREWDRKPGRPRNVTVHATAGVARAAAGEAFVRGMSGDVEHELSIPEQDDLLEHRTRGLERPAGDNEAGSGTNRTPGTA